MNLAKTILLIWIEWNLPRCDGKEIVVDPWITMAEPYPSQSAALGDTVLFRWPLYGAPHNVFVHPSGTCDETGRMEVPAKGSDGNHDEEHDHSGDFHEHVYTFTESDGNEVVFACDIGSHCEAGNQIITFKIDGANSTEVLADTPVITEQASSNTVSSPVMEDQTSKGFQRVGNLNL